jgi:hypothetical protein
MKFRLIQHSTKILAFSALLLTTACKKDINNVTGPSQNTAAATLSDSSTVADNAYNDVLINAFFGYSDQLVNGAAGRMQSGGTATNSVNQVNSADLSCATYTLVTAQGGGYPKTLTLDFGDGCSGSVDSVMRKGKIIYVFSGDLLTPGTTVSATFDQYFVNGYGLQGACSIGNNSTLQNGVSFTLQITNGIFTFPDLTNFHYSANKTIQMTAGSSTPLDFSDDIYSITGNSNFTASDGSSLVSTVTTPLVRAFICKYISAGVISFVYDNSVKGTIDFGDGTCDNAATLVVGSITEQITLR